MIATFYDKNFLGMQNNASLIIDDASYSLVKRGIDFDTLTCTCEAFTENIHPTFIVIKNNIGNYVYGAFAGIPELTTENKTTVNASDLKTIFNNDIFITFKETTARVKDMFSLVFNAFVEQISGIPMALEFEENVDFGNLTDLKPSAGLNVYVAWEVLSAYMKFYNLFIESRLDLINKKIVFKLCKAMTIEKNIKLWEYGVKNYGKWLASVNECQGYVMLNSEINKVGKRWMLLSNNAITNDESLRDMYPVKRKIFIKSTEKADEVSKLYNEVEEEALTALADAMYNENLELTITDASFKDKCMVYHRRGAFYKALPVGELHYNSNGLYKIQIGYRFTGLEFI